MIYLGENACMNRNVLASAIFQACQMSSTDRFLHASVLFCKSKAS